MYVIAFMYNLFAKNIVCLCNKLLKLETMYNWICSVGRWLCIAENKCINVTLYCIVLTAQCRIV